ncbi:hypothetical protein FF011L_15900 [Roseimaritima multifibrata]|uniref:DUF1990 domain-containing protein n=1 Tax=Roseimaritima multifibrata TaxID=1930274 RepID=A0A517MD82_9BACT|nr:DUF1990 domain-containing protein [Roseimaritima multifibrata]QDS92841.1 hypothetical protein FF011L_15900 [Roseimaritima multifibrata]
MLSFTKPNADSIARFLDQQAKLDFNYPDVGATDGELPSHYDHNSIEEEVGRRATDFQEAKAAMLAWKHFNVGWAAACPTTTPIREGENVAILARISGLWALAACRIIEVLHEESPTSKRFGYSFGTLPGHPEQGEERFEVRCSANGIVTYRITAFFRPNCLSAEIAWPYFRYRFNQFRRQSVDRLRRHVQDSS